jgi:hypothetical protein
MFCRCFNIIPRAPVSLALNTARRAWEDRHLHGRHGQGPSRMTPIVTSMRHGAFFGEIICCYPLVNKHSNGKSPFLMGKSTITGHFQ